MAVSSSNGGLGLPIGDLAETPVCGIGVTGVKDSSGRSWRDGGDEISGTVVSGSSSFTVCVTSASGVVSSRSGATTSVSEPPGVGSGKHSKFDFSQRGQTQFLDLGSGRGVAGQLLKGWGWDLQSGETFPIRDRGIHSSNSKCSLSTKWEETL